MNLTAGEGETELARIRVCARFVERWDGYPESLRKELLRGAFGDES